MWKQKISKERWYALGGFKNSNLFRRQLSGTDWTYWQVLDND